MKIFSGMQAVNFFNELKHGYLKFKGPCLIIIGLFLIVSIYFLPFIDARNFFIGDDFVWLYQAEFGRFVPTLEAGDYSYEHKYGSWSFIYHVMPVAIYNDRPVGFVFIKILYEIFGADSAAPYYAALFVLHIINTILFYKYARKFLSAWPSWVAAALSATWYYAIEATTRINAVFDVLAFTFLLISALLFRGSIDSNNKKKYAFAVFCFFIAVRTKEYAIGFVPVLLFQEVFIFGFGIKNTLKRLSGYLIVVAFIFIRYFQLYLDKSSDRLVGGGSDYRMAFNFQGLIENFFWYVSEVFYRPFIPIWLLCLVLGAFVFIYFAGDLKSRRVYIYSILSFASLLGPILLFAEQRGILYLYAPHFFIALILASSLEGRLHNKLIGVLLIAFVSVIPFSSGWKKDSTEWLLARRGEVREQLNSGLPLIGKKWVSSKGNIEIYISGVKPYVNAFVNAWAMWLYFNESVKDLSRNKLYVLGQHTTPTENDFIRKYCDRRGEKIYIEYVNNVAFDRTLDYESNCK